MKHKFLNKQLVPWHICVLVISLLVRKWPGCCFLLKKIGQLLINSTKTLIPTRTQGRVRIWVLLSSVQMELSTRFSSIPLARSPNVSNLTTQVNENWVQATMSSSGSRRKSVELLLLNYAHFRALRITRERKATNSGWHGPADGVGYQVRHSPSVAKSGCGVNLLPKQVLYRLCITYLTRLKSIKVMLAPRLSSRILQSIYCNVSNSTSTSLLNLFFMLEIWRVKYEV